MRLSRVLDPGGVGLRVRACIARMRDLGLRQMAWGTARALRLRDLFQRFADPSMAAKQRTIVDEQLAAMRAGDPSGHFRVAAELLEQIRLKTGDGRLQCWTPGAGPPTMRRFWNSCALGCVLLALGLIAS